MQICFQFGRNEREMRWKGGIKIKTLCDSVYIIYIRAKKKGVKEFIFTVKIGGWKFTKVN